MSLDRFQIGEVSEQIGLSLRSIRHYEEMGIVTPSARSRGGFRLYSTEDVDRLRLIMKMKPLDFSLEEMRDLLSTLDLLRAGVVGVERKEALDRLAAHGDQVEKRWKWLQERLAIAGEFRRFLRTELHERASDASDSADDDSADDSDDDSADDSADDRADDGADRPPDSGA